MEAQNEVLAKVYETLRYQQELLFQARTSIAVLERVLCGNQSFVQARAQAMTELPTPGQIAEQNALLRALSLEIASLRGENLPIGQA
jgi:hypothetical protein